MRSLTAALAALLLAGCAHPLEIRNLDQYRSLARGEPLERSTAVGLVPTAPDEDAMRLVNGVGEALTKYGAKVSRPTTERDLALSEVLARITVTPRYEGSGANWFINFPGLLVGAPSWNGYKYTVGYEFQIFLTRGWDNAKVDSWTVPVTLDVRHSTGMLISPDYNPEVTEPLLDKGGGSVADYVAREIVTHLNSEGRLWKLEPPTDWVPPAPPPPPPPPPPPKPVAAPVVTPTPPAIVPAPAHAKPAPQPAPAKPAPVPKVLATGGYATLKPMAVARNRPVPDGNPVDFDSGEVLLLGKSVKNPSGVWWFVSAKGKVGWAPAPDLKTSLPPGAIKPPPPAPPPPAAEPAIAPAAAPVPAPAPVVVPAAPPPSAAAPAAPFQASAGKQARVRAGASARTRMAPDADAAKGIDGSTVVTLKTPITREGRKWWYVTSPSGSGWVLEGDLQPAP